MRIGQIIIENKKQVVLSLNGDDWKNASKHLSWSNAQDLTIESLRSIEPEDFEQMPQVSMPQTFNTPIPTPGKVVCVGLNYANHVKESGMETPSEPVLFLKSPTAVCGPNDNVFKPDWAEKLDWEVELGIVIVIVIVIGKRTKCIKSADVSDYILGYVVANDISDRTAQLERSGQWTKGKSADGFCPVGPYIVTQDELGNIEDLELQLSVNGIQRQHGKVNDMLFSPAYLIEYISEFMTLEPGDLVLTGTPAGVSLGQPDLPFLQAGDIVSAQISSLGEQKITIADE